MVFGSVKRLASRFGVEVSRRRPLPYSEACVSLRTEAEPRGICLIAYILAPFLEKDAGRRTSHTHFQESELMARTWLDAGFDVDVIDYRHFRFVPARRYDYFVSARKHLAEVGARLNDDCVRIAHLDTAHFATNNVAAYGRLLDFQSRKGLAVPESLRIIEHNLGIDAAHYGVLLGNAATRSTYEYAGKPLYELNVPTAVDFEWAESKDFSSSRNRFLWIGSSGLLHKGLDLAIEAFAGMPEMELVICGPVSSEPRFMDCYRGELAGAPNISVAGWVDVGSRAFAELMETSIGVVYPSCGEGQAGSVVTCVRAGLIPIVSRETGLDVHGFGQVLSSNSVEAIRQAVQQLADLDTSALQARARSAWEHGEAHHTAEAYLARYGGIVADIIGHAGLPSAP